MNYENALKDLEEKYKTWVQNANRAEADRKEAEQRYKTAVAVYQEYEAAIAKLKGML